jgi:hypothetical protein
MRVRWSDVLLLALGTTVLSAQTPRAAASPEPAKPLRHLEYTFSIQRQGLYGAEFNGTSDESLSPVSIGAQGAGANGTMSVDVLAIAPDGALVVRISESLRFEPRARQAYTCTVYGNTTVSCPSVPAPSQAEWVLLSYLGRQFVDAAPWDGEHQWKRTEHTKSYDLAEDFTLLPESNDRRAMIRETKMVSVHNGDASKQREDVTITYDRTLEIPDVIHDDFTAASDNGSDTGHATFDFQLRTDSFAKS